ncbi:hypothetical protein ElyMa_003884600 [Elysia marginata]|uniref:Uncharacterized protein n=1 Tax=Elysia marginata TaxID=1093978 RepID=A0AAV4FL24_9GAST|nr:hypothetical protein ElyMa_003884600 [Elysia marginata]
MLPQSVASRCAATPALLILLFLLSTAPVCLALEGGDFVSETEAVATETRETPDATKDLGRLLFKTTRFRDLSLAAHEGVRASYPQLRRWLGYPLWRSRGAAAGLTGRTKATRHAFNKGDVKLVKEMRFRLIDDVTNPVTIDFNNTETSSSQTVPDNWRP